MPAWVMDEDKWERAKEIAGKQGHSEDWAYVTGIYKRMRGRMRKGIESEDIKALRREAFATKYKKRAKLVINHEPTKKSINRRSLMFIYGYQDIDSRFLNKTWSTELADSHPEGRWITITDESSPLYGRHLFIIGHSDGSATILAGGGDALRHKRLVLRKREVELSPEAEAERQKKIEERKAKKEAKMKENQEKLTPEQTEDLQAKKELAEKQRAAASKGLRKTASDLVDRAKDMAVRKDKLANAGESSPEMAQQMLDLENNHKLKVTDDDKKAIIEEVGNQFADERDRKREVDARIKKLDDVVGKNLNRVVDLARQAVDGTLDESSLSKPEQALIEGIKENAEQLLKYHIAMQENKDNLKEINKFLKGSKSNLKDVPLVEHTEMSDAEVRSRVKDERAAKEALDQHAKLIVSTYGTEKSPKAVNGAAKRGLIAGGTAACNSIVGAVTSSSIVDNRRAKLLGASNMAILTHHHLTESVGDYQEHLDKFVNDSTAVAKEANKIGDDLMERLAQVKRPDGENLVDDATYQARCNSMVQKIHGQYAQAEGALNFIAELSHAKSSKLNTLTFQSSNRDVLESRAKMLGLSAGDYTIRKDDKTGKHTMQVPKESFNKVITETPLAGKNTTQEVKDILSGKANTDDFHPKMIRELSLPDDKGFVRKVQLTGAQQSAARLVVAQKRVYINHGMGTGKTLTYLSAHAAACEKAGKHIPAFIAMPDKTTGNFIKDAQALSGYECVQLKGGRAERAAAIKYAAETPNTILVGNHETFENYPDELKAAKFGFVVADEAHLLTQRGTKTPSGKSEGLKDIASSAEYYIAGTGTPVVNDLSEVFFHLNLARPDQFPDKKKFMERYGSIAGPGHRAAARKLLMQELGGYMHTNHQPIEGVDENGQPIEQKFKQHSYNVTPEIQNDYNAQLHAAQNKEMSQLQVHAAVNKVLNETPHERNPKFDKIKEIIDDHMKGIKDGSRHKGEKIGISCSTYEELANIESFLDKHYPGAGHVSFHGTLSPSQINKNADAIRQQDGPRFSIHMKAGTTGLNLHLTDKNGGGMTTAIHSSSGSNGYSDIDQFFHREHRNGLIKSTESHIVWSNTHHDLQTQMRVEQKKEMGETLAENSGNYKNPKFEKFQMSDLSPEQQAHLKAESAKAKADARKVHKPKPAAAPKPEPPAAAPPAEKAYSKFVLFRWRKS